MMIIIIIIIFIYIVWTRLSFAPGLFSASSHTMGGGHGGGEEEWSTNRLSVLIFWKCSEQFPHPRICLMPACRDQKNLCSSFVQEAQCSSRDHCVQTSRLVSAFQAGIGISCKLPFPFSQIFRHNGQILLLASCAWFLLLQRVGCDLSSMECVTILMALLFQWFRFAVQEHTQTFKKHHYPG